MALMPLIVLLEAIKGDELKHLLVLLDCHLSQATLRSDLPRVLSQAAQRLGEKLLDVVGSHDSLV